MSAERRLALILANEAESVSGWPDPANVIGRARLYLSFLQEGGSGGSIETVEQPRARPNLVAVRAS